MSTVGRRAAGRLRRWSKREYYRLGELGFFDGQRVELLEGHIMVLAPQSPGHVFAVDRACRMLAHWFDNGYHVRLKGPLDLGQTSEPEPDICVVTGNREDYAQAHPTTAVLIVEVSDARVSYDRRRKGSLYARAGIADYWIVNLVDKQLEVYRDPQPDPSQPYGYSYACVTILVPPAVVHPLAAPQVSLAVADLLP